MRAGALRAHATQIDPTSRWFAVPLDVQQKTWPTEDYELARSLVGACAVAEGVADCAIVDIVYAKRRDLALELPQTPLSAVMLDDQWGEGYERVAELVKESAKTGKSIRTLVVEQGLIPEAEVDQVLDLLRLTRGG